MELRAFLEEHLNLQGIDERENWINSLCPMHEEAHRSFGVNKHTLLCKCYVCGRMSLHKVIVNVLGLRKIEALNLIRKNLDPEYSEDERAADFKKKLKARKINILPFKEEYEYFQYAYSKYLIKKGFKKSILRKFGIFYNYEDRRIIFPVFEGGKFVGMMYRNPFDGSQYWYNEGFDKTKFVYNIDNVRRGRPIIIVESAKDIAWMEQHGVTNAVSFFGTNYGKDQIARVCNLSGIFILAMDSDAEGQRANARLFKALPGKQKFRVDFGSYNDPGDMPGAKVVEVFARPKRCFST